MYKTFNQREHTLSFNNHKIITIFSVSTLVIVLIFFMPGAATAAISTYYVDATNGDDSNNGLSDTAAWKTISKVINTGLNPGDKILFKRGEVWREQLIPQSGDETGYITYGAYGTGNKPLLLGSVTRNNVTNWMHDYGNIWTASGLTVDVGNLIFNNEESAGVKVWSEEDLDMQGKFWYDMYNQVLKIYSETNPASYYSNIECALKRHIIDERDKSYVIYENLDLRYGGTHGIGGGNVHHIIVRDCDFAYIGGSIYSVPGTRYGNGVEFWDSAHDTTVERCRLREIYDAALTTQGWGEANEKYNQYFRHNIVWNSEYCFEYWNKPGTSTTQDIYFENNTCINIGYGWGHNQRYEPFINGRHIFFTRNSADTNNFYIRNNIFYETKYTSLSIIDNFWNGLENLVLDYNLWYQSSGEMINYPPCYPDGVKHRVSCDAYTMDQFSDYQTEKGKDEHSKAANPLFVDMSNNNFHPATGSPACTMSETGSYVGALPCMDIPLESNNGGGGCFIATAVYGSNLDENVQVLRDFREEYLLSNFLGRAFMKFYYKLSPPVADYIRKHENLRTTVRHALVPVVYGARYPQLVLFLFGLIVIGAYFIFKSDREK